jgi:uncharacterized protein with HEPN domain
MDRDAAYLLDMLIAARKVIEYTSGLTWDNFHQNEMLQDAVMRHLQIIGEAARSITEQKRNAHQELPWRNMIGMRNRLVHHYFGIELTIVWDTIQKDIPLLITGLEPLIPPERR